MSIGRLFLVSALIGILASLVVFFVSGCDNGSSHIVGPDPALVVSSEYTGNGVVTVSTHNTAESVLDVLDVDGLLLDSVVLVPGDAVVFHNACPGDYQYVLSATLVDIPEAVSETVVPPGDYPAPRDGKTLLCHKGRTICVGDNAVEAHLNHGDLLSPCVEDLETPKFERKYPCEDGGLTLAE